MTEQLHLTRANGTRFTLLLYPQDKPDAPALLIQPAMGVQGSYYTLLAEALHAAGCHVGISELRGHEAAEDARRPDWDYDFSYADMLLEDWPQAAAAMQARFPQAPFYILGHSLGAQISCLYASQQPAQLKGLIIIAACSVHWKLWGFPFLLYSQVAGQIGRLLGHFPGKRFRFAGREARGVMRDWARQARTGRFMTGQPRVDYEPKLAAVTLPVLAISLQGDFFAPRHTMDGLLGKMPKAALTRQHLDPKALGFEKIDHFRWARQPALVLPHVLDWLKNQSLR
jgi:predicted alpha/beta hydrolase